MFKGYEDVNFKLDYFHTAGYSTVDRYWYEIIIVDSLLILNFNSPQNDDWDYVSYQKQIILYEELELIKQTVKDANIHQKKEGFPERSGSGYGSYTLHIESDSLNVDGGIMYSCVGTDNQIEFEKQIQNEKEESTTIGGDYEWLFKELEKLFDSLPCLMEDKNNRYYDE